MRAHNVLALCLTPLLLHACSHPIEIVGQGDVTSASGDRNCYLEDFQAASDNCAKNYVLGAYQETYYAQPRAGWQFDKWVNYCGNATAPNYDCTFSVSADVVTQFWGQTVAPLRAVFKTCTPGAPGCGWAVGNMQTGTQNAYGTSVTAEAGILAQNFAGALGSIVTVGGTFTMRFTSVSAIFTYLPSVGSPGPLTGSLLNPQTSSSGELGGQVLALQLNADLSAAWGNVVDFGSVRFCNYTAVPQLNGQTVDQFLAVANQVLGGGASSLGLPEIVIALRDLNSSFSGGVPSAFAHENLVAATSCP